MKGIDVSRWNGYPFNKVTSQFYRRSEFVICKASQGVTYGYTDVFVKQINKALADGKLCGAYHYAYGNDPKKEAAFFVSVVKPYIGKVILAVDWESNPAWGSTTWVKQFCDEVYRLCKVRCFIYTGRAGIKQCENCYPTYPLWFAGYPTNAATWDVPAFPARYKILPWKAYAIWQYSSGNGRIDLDTTKLTKEQWMKYAVAHNATTTEQQTDGEKSKTETVLDLVYNTMLGKYGSGASRKKALGARYKEVQNVINHVGIASVTTLAKETLAGKYGNGEMRKVVLGKRYTAVQKKINSMMK